MKTWNVTFFDKLDKWNLEGDRDGEKAIGGGTAEAGGGKGEIWYKFGNKLENFWYKFGRYLGIICKQSDTNLENIWG